MVSDCSLKMVINTRFWQFNWLMRLFILTANEALKLGTKDIDLDRMLKIAESKVKEAVAGKKNSCCNNKIFFH